MHPAAAGAWRRVRVRRPPRVVAAVVRAAIVAARFAADRARDTVFLRRPVAVNSDDAISRVS